jgi:hypothetical protein
MEQGISTDQLHQTIPRDRHRKKERKKKRRRNGNYKAT